MPKDAYYFSHDSNAKDDPKCSMLIEQLGLEGYGIYWVLVETLRDQPEYKYPLAMLPIVARKYNTTAEKVRVVVGNYGLFEVIDDQFFSLSLCKRMGELERRRAQQRFAGLKSAEKRLLLNAGSTDVQRSLNGCSTSKVKESKVNKEKKSKEEQNNYDYFSDFWAEYPKKDKKIPAQKIFSRLKMNDELMEKIMSSLFRFIESEQWTKENGKYIPLPTTWLNERRWEDGK